MGWSVRLLGTLAIARDGDDATPSAPMTRRLLVRFLVDVGDRVSADRLIEALWPSRAPADPGSTLHVHVSRLRTELGEPSVISHEANGYVLEIPADSVDAHRFREEADRGLVELISGRWATAAGLLESALQEWSGSEVVPEFEYEDFVADYRTRLLDRRLEVREGLALARARLGQDVDVGELEQLIGRHPRRARLFEALMIGLRGMGRGAEALRAFDRAVQEWGEVGLDAPVDLRRLAGQIATQESEDLHPNIGSQLPKYDTSFLGRDQELDRVEKLLEEARLVTITGPGGVGKTRLAVEIVQRRQTASAVFVPLAAVDQAHVTDAVASALDLSEQFADHHSLARRMGRVKLLIVLDNCEHVLGAMASFVADVMAASPNARFLVTSRAPLRVDGEAVLRLRPLPLESAARDMMLDRLARSVSEESVSLDGDELTDLLSELDGLPLAIELAAALVPAFGFDKASRAIRTHRRGGTDRHQSMDSAIGWSWSLLDDDHQEFLASCALMAGHFSEGEAARIVGITETMASSLLGDLAEASLILRDGQRQAPFRILETIRAFATDQLVRLGVAEKATRGYVKAMVSLAEERGAGWSARNTQNLRQALAIARELGDIKSASVSATALALHWATNRRPADAADLLEDALEEAKTSGIPQAPLLMAMGDFYEIADSARSVALWTDALDRVDDNETGARLHRKIGHALANSVQGAKAYVQARRHFETALALLGRHRGPEWVRVQFDKGALAYWLGDTDAQRAALEAADPVARRLADPSLIIHGATERASLIYRETGYYPPLSLLDELENLRQIAPDPRSCTLVLFHIGFCALGLLQPEPALAALLDAEDIARKQGQVTARLLAYRTIAHRMLNERDELERANERLLLLSRQRLFPMYEAVAHANLAWMRVADRSWWEAVGEAELALEIWDQTEPPYVFQWIALLPLIRADLGLHRHDRIAGIARRLLTEPQRRLPDELREALTGLVTGSDPEKGARKVLTAAADYSLS